MHLNDYIILSTLLFMIGLAGLLFNRNHLIALLMSIELLLLAVNTNFIAFAHFRHAMAGELFVFFVLAVAAAETAIGLAILLLCYRKTGNIMSDDMNLLKG